MRTQQVTFFGVNGYRPRAIYQRNQNQNDGENFRTEKQTVSVSRTEIFMHIQSEAHIFAIRAQYFRKLISLLVIVW